MLIEINTSERVFQVVKMGLVSKQVFCNLRQIPDVLKSEFEKYDEIKIYQFWDYKPKAVTKKLLNEMFSANQIDYKVK